MNGTCRKTAPKSTQKTKKMIPLADFDKTCIDRKLQASSICLSWCHCHQQKHAQYNRPDSGITQLCHALHTMWCGAFSPEASAAGDVTEISNYIFSWDQKLTFNTHKTLRKWARSSEAETASSKRRPVQPPLPFYREDVQPARKGQVNNVLPSRRLIAPSLLTTENIVRSKYSSRKKLLLHEKLPKPPKGASKLTSFRAILAVRRHAAVRAEGLLAPSSARFSVDKRCRLCMHGARALDRCSATHC